MQVNNIESLFSVFLGKEEDQPRNPSDRSSSKKFSAKKTALDVRFGDFSISLSSSRLSGSAPRSAVEQYSRTVEAQKETEQKSIPTNEAAPINQSYIDPLVDRINILTDQIGHLREKVGSLEEKLATRRPSGLNTVLVADPAVLVEAEIGINISQPATSISIPTDLSLYGRYTSDIPDKRTTLFHATV